MDLITKDLFLCHNSIDKDWVTLFGERIEKEIQNEKNLSVFLDAWDIEIGANIIWKLNEGLDKSRFLAVVMTPEMLTSDWCKLEVSSFMMEDPTNRKGKIIPILLRDTDSKTGERINIPPVLRSMNFLDFRNPKNFEKEYARLVAKIKGMQIPRSSSIAAGRRESKHRDHSFVQPPLANERSAADSVTEALVSNLLPVKAPEFVWSAPTFLTSKRDLHEFYRYPAFIVRSGKLYTFTDLSNPKNKFFDFIKPGSKTERISSSDWRADSAKWKWIIELMNDSLRRYLWNEGVNFHPKSERYFFRPNGKKSVFIKWGAGDKRCVVKYPKDGKGNWVHQAARLHFELLGTDLYLSIDPSWMFTIDGFTSVTKENASPLAAKWGGRERNGGIIRHVLMWSDMITQGNFTAEIDTDGQFIEIGRMPATAMTSVGIADDRVAIRALLQFTDEEKSLSSDDEPTFGFVADTTEAAPKNEATL